MKKIIFLLFLVSCSSKNIDNHASSVLLDFNKDLSFNEFKMLLEKYNEITDIPEIDK